MEVVPYLNFDGRCAEAFRFYEKVLGGKIETLMTFGGTPAESFVPPEWRDKVLHARLNIGSEALMGTDAPPDRFEQPKGYSVTLQLKDPAEAERIFRALADRATIKMPFEKTFWAEKFGMLVDRFGTPWTINCDPAA
jgi:PhnB protein